ncbi:formate-dependent nitrite reductase membrane component NrfD [Scopulibacillus daqui]|uniref:Formate-dependent nitrite reductase membrane component NrfD n=1 Tax=Scopulibacillus daqui TaxID=1469162 RepID=A0ABS2Q031_9BACL|nr:DUF2663 family protein [Scopulibacillus daqui]MBM7645325.1 formate-dependent nitrite reductase membrane component NrfD [Scopulibacillus daqui]
MSKLKELRDSGQIPDITYRILLKLIERKEEEAKFKKRRSMVGLAAIVVYSALIYYLFFYKLESMQAYSDFSSIISDPFLWLLGIAAFIMTIAWHIARKNYDDADEDYDELRKEIIDRNHELWYEQMDWKGKSEVLEFLDKEKDINLYHK